MELNVNQSKINAVIAHVIYKKERSQEYSSYDLENHVLMLSEQILTTFKLRINDAIGIASKSFKLKIADVSNDSFYNYAKSIINNPDNFVEYSQDITEKLAMSQRKRSISAGYLFVIYGETFNNSKYVIALKAEAHEALSIKKDNDGNISIEFLEDIFLSPSSKFYKIGLIYEDHNEDETYPNSDYSCILFDNQFNPQNNPAEYFSDDFLGFDTNDNDKILTRRLFDQLNDFIYDNISDYSRRVSLTGYIRNFFRVDSATIDPVAIRDQFFSFDNQIRDRFSSEILTSYPRPFIKNNTLIDFTLKTRKVFFPDKVRIEAPEDVFDDNVTVLNADQFEEVESSGDDLTNYTIILVKGHPYDREQVE